MAQNTMTLSGSTFGTLTFATGPAELSRDADEVRLLLQLAADQGGRFTSYPSELGGAIPAAERAGWLNLRSPPSTPITDKNGVVTGASSSGFASWSLTEDGRKELAARNDHLGPAATRMAHETRFFPGAGVVAYGAAKRVPLSMPVKPQDGGLVIDR